MSTIRYALTSGMLFVFLYLYLVKRTSKSKIQQELPKKKDLQRELFYSWLTLMIFSLFMMIPLNSILRPYTMLYYDVQEFGWGYLIFTCIVLVFIHDAYFYLIHRLLHSNAFKKYHIIHHKSTNPTPLAALSFHPVEAILQVMFFVIVLFLIPLHLFAIGFLGLFLFVHNAYGHSGFELSKFKNNKFFVNSINHNLHHKHYHGNYGLYFTIWDRLFKTKIKKD